MGAGKTLRPCGIHAATTRGIDRSTRRVKECNTMVINAVLTTLVADANKEMLS